METFFPCMIAVPYEIKKKWIILMSSEYAKAFTYGIVTSLLNKVYVTYDNTHPSIQD